LQTHLLPIILPHGVGVGKINLSKTTFLSLFLAVGFMVGMSFSSVYAGIPWSTSEIANDAITSAKILNKQIFAPDIHFAAVKSNKIKDGTILGADIGSPLVLTGAITADNYFDKGNTQTGVSATALGGSGNIASGDVSSVGGGSVNTAGPGKWSTVGGGFSNTASGLRSTVAGGGCNTLAIGGCIRNVASGEESTIGGGRSNVADNDNTVISGGLRNSAEGVQSTVGGGGFNHAVGAGSTISGGTQNNAEGRFASVPGGDNNDADGDYSFAAGRKAKALVEHPGAFVWADSTNANFFSTAADEFSIRAGGGVRVQGDINCTLPGCFEVTLNRFRIVVPASGSINAVLDCANPTASVTGFYIDDRSNGSSPANIIGDSVSITPDGNTLTLTLDTKGSSQDTINIYFICLGL